MNKRKWLKDSKVRLIATVAGAISAIIAAGALFDLRVALGVLAAEVAACVVYSLHKLLKKWQEARK